LQLEIMQRVKEHDPRIWTPGGGDPPEVVAAARMVREYDENLELGRHTMTGDWCIWLRRGADQAPYPVLGIGPNLPPADTLQERLRAADTRVHGDSILRDMRARNEAHEAAQERLVDEATGIAAEAYEWAQRDIKGYSGRTANVKGRKRDTKPKES
jgi:hypothetical protein